MTDPTGGSFLSYARQRAHEAALLIAAQRDRGIPTWQDLENLGPVHTQSEIRKVLADPRTANAILWITPEVERSDFIRTVEAPLILKRMEADDGFFPLLVAAGGLSREDAARLFGPAFSAHDLLEWNMEVAASDPIDASEAARLARCVLLARLKAIQQQLPETEPLSLQLYVRTPSDPRPGTSLVLDWSRRFNERRAQPGAWNDHLLPALRDLEHATSRHASRRAIEASGLPSLSAGLALGYTFMAPRAQGLTFFQPFPDAPGQSWSLQATREPSGFEPDIRPSQAGATDLAVLVSVTAEVENAFRNSLPTLPPFAAIVRITREGAYPHRLASPGAAVHLAKQVEGAIREVATEFRTVRTHLFLAGPVGLAVLIGQLLNTLGPIHTYENVGGLNGHYEPELVLGD